MLDYKAPRIWFFHRDSEGSDILNQCRATDFFSSLPPDLSEKRELMANLQIKIASFIDPTHEWTANLKPLEEHSTENNAGSFSSSRAVDRLILPMKRLAILSTHPIQYNAPLFRMLAQEESIDLKVFYSKKTEQVRFDKDFGQEVTWDVPLTEGYAA